MNRFFGLLVVGFALLGMSTAELPGHGTQLKSLKRAEYECRQYLQSADGCSDPKDCLDHCKLLVLRSWNDTSSKLIPYPFSKHFQPDADDQDYKNRTLQCIADGVACVPPEDVCRRATISWNCYRDQYGTAVGTPQLVPANAVLLMNALNQCASMLSIEEAELELYIRSVYEIAPKARCLLRCLKLRLGLWNDVTGPNLPRLFVQCGGYGRDEKEVNEAAYKCYQELRSKCYDNCTLATRVANDCFPKEITLPIVLCKAANKNTCPYGDPKVFKESGLSHLPVGVECNYGMDSTNKQGTIYPQGNDGKVIPKCS